MSIHDPSEVPHVLTDAPPSQGAAAPSAGHAFSGRALTVRNPWPFAIHSLDKRCENRTKPPPAAFVGPGAPWIAMHTGCHTATREEWSLLDGQAREAGWFALPHHGINVYERSKGKHVWQVGSRISLIPGLFRILSYDAPYLGDLTGWRNPADFGYRIEYRALPTPIRCLGPTPKPGKSRSCNLGWWVVPDDVAAVIRGVL